LESFGMPPEVKAVQPPVSSMITDSSGRSVPDQMIDVLVASNTCTVRRFVMVAEALYSVSFLTL
jgi:hypothetical protein